MMHFEVFECTQLTVNNDTINSLVLFSVFIVKEDAALLMILFSLWHRSLFKSK